MNFLLGEARFYFAQCVFNTSCHYAAYDRYEKERNKRHNIALTISSLSIISLCLTVLCWETSCQVFLRILSLLGILLTAVSLIFELYNKEDITEVMCYHKQAAEDYKQLRDSFMDIIRQVKSKAEISVVESRLHKCLHDYSILGKYSLPTNERKHSVNHVFSSPTSIINFTSKKQSYDDTRRSSRDNELLQRAQSDL